MNLTKKTKLAETIGRKCWRVASVMSLSTLILSACGGGSSSSGDDDHSNTDIDTAGRLALYNQDDNAISILELDSGEIIDSFALTGGAPRIYASPDKRYAIVVQRDDGQVSFVDSGLYTEDHGDHLHDYAVDPRLLNFTLTGSKPTHYTAHDNHAAVFFDAETGLGSSVTLISDSSIGSGNTLGELSLSNNMHGVAKLIDDQLFVTYRDPSITNTILPAEVERYSFENSNFTFENRYTEQCPLLHGSGATDEWILFGCGDGVLAIDLTQNNYPAVKLANPDSIMMDGRIGSIASHHELDTFVGITRDQFFAIDVSNLLDPYQEFTLPAGVSRIAHGFNQEGEFFYILGDDGVLYLFDTDDWTSLDPILVTDPLEEDDINPAVAVSSAENRLFVLNPQDQQIIEVNSENGSIVRTIDINFTASRLVWLGLSEFHDHND